METDIAKTTTEITPDVMSDIEVAARDAISARAEWEERQQVYYKLRHNGIKRPAPPWPGAADMNWPLCDMMIEKLKPYYIQQTFANELVANFFSLRSDDLQFNVASAQWFDYRVRQQTNFEMEIISVADYMLMGGKGIMKIYWDDDKQTVVYDSVDPMFFIVPEHTVTLKEADWCLQVHQLSPAAYKRNKSYNQGILDDIVSTNKAELAAVNQNSESEKAHREGITMGQHDEQIILWEVYQKQEDGTVIMFTMCPHYLEDFVREPVELPYDHGQFPYVEFNAEVKDKGFYASRGIPERVSAMQMSMSKLWNEKLDALTAFNRPMFVASNPLSNTGNIRMRPGEVLPFGVTKVSMDTPPINWDVEINQHRSAAEQLIGVPDAGLTSQFSSNERRTASEVNLIGSVMTQVVDLRSRVFRRALGEAFSQSWSLFIQYSKDDLHFFFRNEIAQIPPAALHGDYRIEPLASADNFNKQFVFQKKVQRFQLLQNNPFVNQGNLVRDLIAADDPQDVKSLYMDNDTQSGDQMEDQASEIARMLIGFPSQVKPVDDDATHLVILKQFVERRIQTGEGIDGELATLLMNHANMHFRQLQMKDPNAAAQVEAEMQKMATFLGQIVGEAQGAMNSMAQI